MVLYLVADSPVRVLLWCFHPGICTHLLLAFHTRHHAMCRLSFVFSMQSCWSERLRLHGCHDLCLCKWSLLFHLVLPIPDEMYRPDLHQPGGVGKTIEIPSASASLYEQIFKTVLGYEEIKVIDWTSSAGDWTFGIMESGYWGKMHGLKSLLRASRILYRCINPNGKNYETATKYGAWHTHA